MDVQELDDYEKQMTHYMRRLKDESNNLLTAMEGLKNKRIGLDTAYDIAEQYLAKHRQEKARKDR